MNKASLAVAIGMISAAAATPVFAQSNTTSNTTTTTGATRTTAATGANWLRQPGSNDWLASHLKGVNVYNDQNQKLGSIDELILDRQGKVQAAVLDVGGFLGMGVHRVAVPFEQLHFTDRSTSRVSDTRSTTGGPALNNNANNAPGNPTAVGPANTGVGNPTTTNGQNAAATRNDVAANNGAARNDNVPDHATLNMTADQLKAAPEFRYNS